MNQGRLKQHAADVVARAGLLVITENRVQWREEKKPYRRPQDLPVGRMALMRLRRNKCKSEATGVSTCACVLRVYRLPDRQFGTCVGRGSARPDTCMSRWRSPPPARPP